VEADVTAGARRGFVTAEKVHLLPSRRLVRALGAFPGFYRQIFHGRILM
jgi:hypothetical protein